MDKTFLLLKIILLQNCYIILFDFTGFWYPIKDIIEIGVIK